jgi:hypothetical protein
MSEQHLDDAIDRAVREIMNVDADAAFRTRVLARVERRATQWPGWPRWAAAGAAIGAVVLAFVLMRAPANEGPEPASVKHQPTQALEQTPTAPENRTAVAAANPPIKSPSAGPAQRTIVTPDATHGLPAGTIAGAVVEDPRAVTIEALERIEPIALAPLAPSTIAPAPIEFAPLEPIARVQIAPLSPPVERD